MFRNVLSLLITVLLLSALSAACESPVPTATPMATPTPVPTATSTLVPTAALTPMPMATPALPTATPMSALSTDTGMSEPLSVRNGDIHRNHWHKAKERCDKTEYREWSALVWVDVWGMAVDLELTTDYELPEKAREVESFLNGAKLFSIGDWGMLYDTAISGMAIPLAAAAVTLQLNDPSSVLASWYEEAASLLENQFYCRTADMQQGLLASQMEQGDEEPLVATPVSGTPILSGTATSTPSPTSTPTAIPAPQQTATPKALPVYQMTFPQGGWYSFYLLNGAVALDKVFIDISGVSTVIGLGKPSLVTRDENDLLTGNWRSAIREENGTWNGSLTYLTPDDCYWLHVSNPHSVMFPADVHPVQRTWPPCPQFNEEIPTLVPIITSIQVSPT